MPTLRLRRTLAATVATVAAVTLAACGDDGVSPNEVRTPLPFTVSGTLVNQRGTPIPADARAVVVWSGDDGNGDYAYVWGSGTVNATTGRFAITFPQDPPNVATLGAGGGARLGVGFVVLLPGASAIEGRVVDPEAFAGAVLGIATGHAVVYREGRVQEAGFDWPMRFRPGFNVGRVVPAAAGQTWDTFEPSDADGVRLIVDDPRTLRVPNWS